MYGNPDGRPANTESSAQGLYLDDHSFGVTVTGNTVINADSTLQLHNSYNNILRNNTFYGARRYGLWFPQDSGFSILAPGKIVNNNVESNIVFPAVARPPLEFQSGLYYFERDKDCLTNNPTTCFYNIIDPGQQNSFASNTYSGLYTEYVAHS